MKIISLVLAALIATGSMAHAQTAKPSFKRVNVDNGKGLFQSALRVKLPNGDVRYILVGELGLTSSILFDPDRMQAFGRDLLKQERAQKLAAQKAAQQKAAQQSAAKQKAKAKKKSKKKS